MIADVPNPKIVIAGSGDVREMDLGIYHSFEDAAKKEASEGSSPFWAESYILEWKWNDKISEYEYVNSLLIRKFNK
jgi:hypothetical protein